MSHKVQVLLVDDLEGCPADETVTFGIDGIAYEIDLTHANADKLRELLVPYTGKGRKMSRRANGARTRGRSASLAAGGVDREAAKIRSWAKEHGYSVSERGRVPADIKSAYATAHS